MLLILTVNKLYQELFFYKSVVIIVLFFILKGDPREQTYEDQLAKLYLSDTLLL